MRSHGIGLTAQGRQRSNNEDALHVDDKLGLYVVCDGAGGHACGELAAATAIRSVVNTYAQHTDLLTLVRRGREPHSALEQLAFKAADHAAQRVYQIQQAHPQYAGMGSTMTLLNVVADKAIVAHVGDSRAYLQQQGIVRQLTTDHTVTAMLVQHGHLTPAEEAHHAYRNYLTRAMGMRPPVPIQTLRFGVMPGDRLLLCTDGLSDCLESTESLAAHLEHDLGSIPRALVDLAHHAGSGDDTTAIAVGIESLPRQTATQRIRRARRRLEAAVLGDAH